MQQNLTQQVSVHQNLLKKADLSSLKAEADKLGIDKLEKVPSDLNKFKSI